MRKASIKEGKRARGFAYPISSVSVSGGGHSIRHAMVLLGFKAKSYYPRKNDEDL